MLEVRDLSVSYGQHRALDGARLVVGKREIVVILGANGAGKSTLLKAICGISEGDVSGSVTMDGIELVGLPPHRIVEEGIALVPEGRGIFPDLTVEENLALGAYATRARDEEAGNLERVLTLFPKLAERRRQVVRTMSGGEQQMVAIGRAMMSNPAILALDEPSLGLSPLLVKDLFQSLRRVRAAGLGILLVEQNAKQSLRIADRGYLLENGEIVHEDDAKAMADDPAVQRAYLGAGGGAAARPATAQPATASPKPAPRPSAATSPSDIAAAAVEAYKGRSKASPAGPARPAAAVPPPPSPAPQPRLADRAPAAHRPEATAKPDLDALVARASALSSRRPLSRPNGGGETSPPTHPSPPAAQAATQTPMPDLGSSADRLRAALSEIEAAARRAETYRPNRNSRDPRR